MPESKLYVIFVALIIRRIYYTIYALSVWGQWRIQDFCERDAAGGLGQLP